MLVRNTLIYEDNGAGEISQGAGTSRTNQMSGNKRYILFTANITTVPVKLTP